MNEIQISVTGLLPTKENIEVVAARIIQECEQGNINPVELAVKVSALENVIKQVREGIREQVLSELSREGGNTSRFGAKVERREVGVKWDYSASPAWNAIKEKADAAEKLKKEVEKMAQMMPEHGIAEYPNPDTGEMLAVVKGAKSSTTSFVVTLPK